MSCVVVLGFYRSGSSAVAGLLHHLGVHMGDRFDEPNEFNPHGYWEDLAFKDLHKAMMDGENVENEYIELIRRREELPLWGVKDPRLCLLLPNLVDNLKTDVRIIHTIRGKPHCIESIRKALPQQADGIDKLFDVYMKHAHRFIQEHLQIPACYIHFDNLYERTQSVVAKVANFVGRPITEAAKNFIRPPSNTYSVLQDTRRFPPGLA